MTPTNPSPVSPEDRIARLKEINERQGHAAMWSNGTRSPQDGDDIAFLLAECARLAASLAEQEQLGKRWRAAHAQEQASAMEECERANQAEASLAAQAQEAETASRLIGLYLTEIGELKKERDTYKRAYEVDMAAQAQRLEGWDHVKNKISEAIAGPLYDAVSSELWEDGCYSWHGPVCETINRLKARVAAQAQDHKVLMAAADETRKIDVAVIERLQSDLAAVTKERDALQARVDAMENYYGTDDFDRREIESQLAAPPVLSPVDPEAQ